MNHEERRQRVHRLEARVLRIVERVQAGRPVEDATVELKTRWPVDASKAARRIAGHANAARGVPILWLIGIDEKGRTIVGAYHRELADWYPRVVSEFDDLAPELLDDLIIPVEGGKDVVALQFETARAPYVVKNRSDGPVEREVPWRQGTRVRSAKRSDLLRMLSPRSELPTFDTIYAKLRASMGPDDSEGLHWHLDVHLYVGLRGETLVAIPVHKCAAAFEVPQFFQSTPFNRLEFFRLDVPSDSSGRHRGSPTIDATPHDLLIRGPGAVRLSADGQTPLGPQPATDARVVLIFAPHDSELSARLCIELTRIAPRAPSEPKGVTVWEYSRERSY